MLKHACLAALLMLLLAFHMPMPALMLTDNLLLLIMLSWPQPGTIQTIPRGSKLQRVLLILNLTKRHRSVIKELQDHLDQCQASIARLQRENEAMAAMLSLAHDTLGAQQCQHDQVSKAVYLTHEAHLSKVQPTAKEAHLHKAQCHSPRRA
jgi:hypothetical protein